jgi:hypothetical protein
MTVSLCDLTKTELAKNADETLLFLPRLNHFPDNQNGCFYNSDGVTDTLGGYQERILASMSPFKVKTLRWYERNRS